MMTQKTAVLLINVGTPDSPRVKDVRRYLTQFLNDPRVIDLPWLPRKILVNAIIVPFRAPKSSKLYKMLWTENGSPLMYFGNELQRLLQEQLGINFRVFLGMRYGNPALKCVLEGIRNEGFQKLVVIPLFPQYASSTTGTAIRAVLEIIEKWNVIPDVRFVSQFYRNPEFIEAFATRIKSYRPETYDHIVFSYHGLPIRHIDRIHPEISHAACECTRVFPAHGEFCYKATCYETTRMIAQRLSISNDQFTVSFQSRLTNNWLEPFTDRVITDKAKAGAHKILIAAPAFVADCLETTVELGIEYKKLFIEAGGTQLNYVESLNDMPEWVQALKKIVETA
jgi:ferrochelatase